MVTALRSIILVSLSGLWIETFELPAGDYCLAGNLLEDDAVSLLVEAAAEILPRIPWKGNPSMRTPLASQLLLH